MNVRSLLAVGTLVLILASPAASSSSGTALSASLTASQAAVSGTASGHFTGSLQWPNSSGGTLTWTLSVSGLSGAPKAITANFGRAGALAVALCTRSAKSCATHGSVSVSSTVAELLPKGLISVTVATTRHPQGEIRGIVKAH